MPEARGAAEDRRVRAAIARLVSAATERRRLLAGNDPRLRSVRASELVVEEARRHRRQAPQEALRWAELAVEIAERATGPCVGDARAEAWAEVGNAHRITCCWDLAAAAFRRAEAALEDGTGDPMAAATVASLHASLALARDRPEEATRLLTAALPGVVEAEETVLAVRLLIKLATACSMDDDPLLGLASLEHGWRLLPEDADPPVRVALAHETLYLTLQAGDAERALWLYRTVRPIYQRHGTEVECAAGRWIAGRALGEVGALDEAVLFLASARRVLERNERAMDVGILIVDQALIELDRAPGRAMELLAEALPLLAELGLSRATLGALRLAAEARERFALRRLVEDLRRARGAPPAARA